ncbi:MAG: amidohydrolase, partial [Dehalococcoidia bacterium]
MPAKNRLAFLGGVVFTADARNSIAGGVYVEDGRVRAVGHAEEIVKAIPQGTQTIDIQGKTLVPGFMDAHNHMPFLGASLAGPDFGYPRVASIGDLVKAVEETAGQVAEGQWIRGGGMDYGKYPEGRMPTRWDIDRASGGHPVSIGHVSGHFALVNSLALQEAGIHDETPDPKGGKLVRDEKGRVTGMLLDAAMQVVERSEVDVGNHGPALGYTASLDELVENIEQACLAYHAAGITSVVDPQVTRREMPAYLEARRRGKLRVKTTCMFLSNHLVDVKALGLGGDLGDPWLSVGPMKFYCDGSLIGCTAAFYSPYENQPDNQGYTFWSPEELKAILLDAHSFGLQVGIHTQGDRAIDMVLDSLEEALRKHPREDHRHRIEHCGYPTDEQLERIARLGIIPVNQPRYLYEVGDNFIANLGEDRARRLIPMRSELDLGIRIALSTDADVVSYEPLNTIEAAVTRVTLEGHDLGKEERITVGGAIRAYTIDAAHSVFQEKEKGSIEVGKAADLALINGDLLNTPGEDISKLSVEMTVLDG